MSDMGAIDKVKLVRDVTNCTLKEAVDTLRAKRYVVTDAIMAIQGATEGDSND